MSEQNASSSRDAMARMQAVLAKKRDLSQQVTRLSAAAQEVSEPQQDAHQQVNLQNNPVYKIMADEKKSSNEKIRLLSDYLSAEGEDPKTAQARFTEFETYFGVVQGKGTEVYKEAIQRLVDEVKGGLKPQVEQIVRDLNQVQQGADEIRKLIQVMHDARLNGQTVAQVTEALKFNDRIVGEIDSLTKSLQNLNADLADKKADQTTATDAKIASDKFWPTVFRLGFSDKAVNRTLADAIQAVKDVQGEITRTKGTLDTKNQERNTALESGPMLILRTFDHESATETGFSAKVVDTAESALKLIQNTQRSVEILVTSLIARKDEAANINRNVTVEKVREAILEGALTRLADTAHTRSDGIKEQLAAKDKELEGHADNALKAAELKADRVGLAESEKAALRYEEAVKGTLAKFVTIASNTESSEHEVLRLSSLLQATENMLSQIHIEALPAATRGLLLSLEEGVAARDAGLTQDVANLLQKGREIAKQGFADVRKMQEEMRTQELQHMEQLITVLEEATTDVVTEAENKSAHGKQRSEKAFRLRDATQGLQQIMQMYAEFSADNEGIGAHGGVTDVILGGDRGGGAAEPTRPAANGNSAPTKTAVGAPVPPK